MTKVVILASEFMEKLDASGMQATIGTIDGMVEIEAGDEDGWWGEVSEARIEGSPARAWLLAILKALITQENTQ